MDEVQELFSSTLVTGNSRTKTEFEDLYKNWGRPGSQEERRKSLLETQKGSRNEILDQHRGIVSIVDAVEHENDYRRNRSKGYRPTIYVAGFHKTSPLYKDVLMLSEWMVDTPDDFNHNWYVVPCPMATRVLLVAYRGITKVYSKYGQFMFVARTALPGGNPMDTKRVNQMCVLDCFWQEKNRTLYVLDLLAWNNQQMTNCEAEFRNYWLIEQFKQFADCRILSQKNEIIFSLLPKTLCSKEAFNKFMMNYPPFEGNFPPIDGLLFYHKQAHYIGGKTPLVGWLYPYMVQEVLGTEITVHESYLDGMPIDYVDQRDFIIRFEQKYAKKNKFARNTRSSTNSSNNDSMDTDHDAKNESDTIEKDLTNESDKRTKVEGKKTKKGKRNTKRNINESEENSKNYEEKMTTDERIDTVDNTVDGRDEHINSETGDSKIECESSDNSNMEFKNNDSGVLLLPSTLTQEL